MMPVAYFSQEYKSAFPFQQFCEHATRFRTGYDNVGLNLAATIQSDEH